MEKSEWRQCMLLARSKIADRAKKDKLLTTAALRLAESAQNVFVYVSMGSEADTHGIIRALYGKKNVAVPCTAPDKTMHACRLRSLDLTCDRYGNVREQGEVCDGQADLIFVPLLGFRQDCHRIGYGAGCYDRYFSQFPSGQKVGLAYDEQLCSFAIGPNDIPLDRILTPEKCFRREK
ncbi:MAG: 5-formyltetrahydrofolate cyclo-ligase [Clostridia bacterium]|nr:5-formyltetrahydrofolate cyclo-ligase [Clostridia bacterium]